MEEVKAVPEDKILYRDELCKALGGVTTETLRRWMKNGKVPQPDIAMSQKTLGWRYSTLLAAGVRIL